MTAIVVHTMIIFLLKDTVKIAQNIFNSCQITVTY